MKLTYRRKGNATERRKSALKRLKQQLVDAVKKVITNKTNFANKTEQLEPLTEADVKRINAEIQILESRI